jgi:predicted enzyme related to lactoylglutathione lyase
VYIQNITLAVTHMPEMIAFYDAVFHANLKPLGAGPLYKGTFAGQVLVLCPNDIAGVEAKQNRHQFRLAVPNLPALQQTVLAAGGQIINQGKDDAGKLLIGMRDPDGNTYEFVQE